MLVRRLQSADQGFCASRRRKAGVEILLEHRMTAIHRAALGSRVQITMQRSRAQFVTAACLPAYFEHDVVLARVLDHL